jgi:protein TonB
VAPSSQNRSEVVRAMELEYPSLLRDAGIGGTVRIFFFIDENGVVQHFEIDQSSGHQALDDAALRVARVYRFTAALNRDKKVPVWVTFPITFQVR